MSFTLGDEDRRAVDMLLNREGSSSKGNGGVADGGGSEAAAAKNGEFQRRIQRVEAILSVLSNMPSGETPPDLVKNTLQRITEAPTTPQTARQTVEPLIDSTRPTA